MLITAFMTMHLTTGGGPVCAPIPDRDGDGRPEIVMATSSYAMKREALLVFLSKSRKVGQIVEPADESPEESWGFGRDLAPVDSRLAGDCLLLSDLGHENDKEHGKGVVYRFDKNLKELGRIEPGIGEEWFGVHLALGEFHAGEQLLAIQLEKSHVPEKPYWTREWFAIYSLTDHRRKGIIQGSYCADPGLADRRGASVVCAWIPDCDGDGVQDIAIDMRDSIALYSGKDLHALRTIPYAQYLTKYQEDDRSLTLVHEADGSASLFLGLPGMTISRPERSFLLAWHIDGRTDVRRIENPSDGAGFGFAMCQIDSGDCFATGLTGFDSTVAFAKPDNLANFKVVYTGPWEADVGSAISRIGDFDGDGIEDVAVTCFQVERPAKEGQGVILFSGKTHNMIGRIELHGGRYEFR